MTGKSTFRYFIREWEMVEARQSVYMEGSP